MNNIILKGRIVHTPELKHTPSGVAVCGFSIAVDRRFKSTDGEKTTDFFDIVAWRNSGEFVAKYFSKGQEILVSGEMQTRTYTDKSGNKRKAYEVIADRVEFCGGNTGRAEATEKPQTFSDSEYEEVKVTEEQLPF